MKVNNIFYHDINIDNDILQRLPENGLVVKQLSQFIDDRTLNKEEGSNDEDNESNENYFISQTFVFSLLTKYKEDSTINEILNRMQHDHKNSRID